MKKSHSISLIVFSVVALIAICCGATFFFTRSYDAAQEESIISSIIPVRENNFNYKYIYPLLGYNLKKALPVIEDKHLKELVSTYIQNQIAANNIQSASFYFRNLATNQWAGVNENDQYHPGSLIKIVIAMGWYRQAQQDPSALNRMLVYTSDIKAINDSIPFADKSDLTLGQSYTVKDLIARMLEQSDNGAERLLLVNADNNILNQAYTDLGIANPDENPNNYTISTNDLAAFFRILYNATYLTEANSEELMSFLAKSTYTSGIVAGVPSSIEVAQKYGEDVTVSSDNQTHNIQLGNCGVVYAKPDPYEICVMTSGQGKSQDDENRLASVIAGISKTVYGYQN